MCLEDRDGSVGIDSPGLAWQRSNEGVEERVDVRSIEWKRWPVVNIESENDTSCSRGSFERSLKTTE